MAGPSGARTRPAPRLNPPPRMQNHLSRFPLSRPSGSRRWWTWTPIVHQVRPGSERWVTSRARLSPRPPRRRLDGAHLLSAGPHEATERADVEASEAARGLSRTGRPAAQSSHQPMTRPTTTYTRGSGVRCQQCTSSAGVPGGRGSSVTLMHDVITPKLLVDFRRLRRFSASLWHRVGSHDSRVCGRAGQDVAS